MALVRIDDQQDVASKLCQQATHLGANAAEVGFSFENGYTVNARMGDVDTLEHHQGQQAEITVYVDKRVASCSTSDLSEQGLARALEKALSIAQFTEADPFAGLADPALLATEFPDLDLFHPWSLTPAQAIELAVDCETQARELDARITRTEGATIATFEWNSIYANTLGFCAETQRSRHRISCTVVAESESDMQSSTEYTVARDPAALQSVTSIAAGSVEKTIAQLNPRRLATQTCPVLFDPQMARTLWSALIAAISGGNLYRQSSFLLNQLDQTIFPEFVNVVQQPRLLKALASSAYDREGVATDDFHFIDQGRLVSYALGSYSARKLGMTSTGNAGGVYNVAITPGTLDFAGLLQEMDTGLLVTSLMGDNANLITGDYSRGVSGFWVEKGEIQFPVAEITIAGNLKDMFQGIVAIGTDIDTRSNIRTGSVLISQMTLAGD